MNRSKAAIVLTGVVAGYLTVSATAVAPQDEERAIVHVLNRIAFGPGPGDIEKVRQIGLSQYIDQQLHPERVDDSAMSAKLNGLTTLTLGSREIAEKYERPVIAARLERRRAAANATDPATNPDARQMNAERQQANLPLADLSQQKILRAVYSERQLQEVLTDFWFNHFNVDARKGPVRFLLTEYERDAIRPHVLGRFRDLLGATAKSPAMLFYLDNWMSADPAGPPFERALRPGVGPRRLGRAGVQRPSSMTPDPQALEQMRRRMPTGLNENYARELMELHTLGVDGGYTQKDVTEVARALTGWSIAAPRQGGGFRFAPALHDDGEKVVMGHVIKAGGGERDGEEVLDILAAHPSTARFIATALARRFVSDTPPPALVDRLAGKFRESDGDLRAVMALLLSSPEFLSPDAVRAKVKTPFDFMVSALRATNAEIADARPLARALQQLGMPLYLCQPPTGYKDATDAWVNTGALIGRMNQALALAEGRVRGVRIASAPSPDSLVGGGVSDATRATIAKAANRPQAIALALGSPEFQRR